MMSTTAAPRGAEAAVAAEAAALRRRSTTVQIAQVISYIAYAFVVISLIILLLGFVLQLLAANPDAGFTQWVYGHLDRVMQPFRGIFPQAIGEGGSVLDVSILFAMLVYSLVALGVRSLLDWLTYRQHRLERQLQQRQREQRMLAPEMADQSPPYPPRAPPYPAREPPYPTREEFPREWG